MVKHLSALVVWWAFAQPVLVRTFTSCLHHGRRPSIGVVGRSSSGDQWRGVSTIDQQRIQQRSLIISCGAKTPSLQPVPSDQDNIPIPFVDVQGNNFIECYADSMVEIDGVQYTIGVPCDYAVALCYFREDQQLVPIELNDPLMDDVYPIAESILEEEFGEGELVLQRTPQTLTLVGELEEDGDEEDEDFDLDDDDEDDDGDEEVEVLLSFEQDGRQYNLVRMLDPMLVVGKSDPDQPQNRILLSPEESEKIMPILEEIFLDSREDLDDVVVP